MSNPGVWLSSGKSNPENSFGGWQYEMRMGIYTHAHFILPTTELEYNLSCSTGK
jgi:hypothetical protein